MAEESQDKLQNIINNIIINKKYDNKDLVYILYDTITKIEKTKTRTKSNLYSLHNIFHSDTLHNILHSIDNLLTRNTMNTRNTRNIKVFNEDTFNVAIRTKSTCVLNLGNAYGTGGGAIYGQMAQEEELCRRSTLLMSLFEFNGCNIFDHGGNRYIPQKSVLYTPDVLIVKDDKYKPLKTPYKCNVITACAVRYNTKQSYSKVDKEIMYKVIENILSCAYINGNKSIVLGALGCGAFNNDAHECAYIFKDIINRYYHLFDNIYFAVLSNDSHQHQHQHHNTNFDIFNEILSS